MSLLRQLLRRTNNTKCIIETATGRSFSTLNPKPKVVRSRPTAADYDDQINQAGSSGDFETVRRLLNKRMANGCFYTNNTFKFLSNTSSYSSVLEDLRRTLAQTDGGFTRKSAHDHLIARLCKLGQIDDAMSVTDEMVRRKYGPTVATFYPILSTLTKKKKMEEAWRLMDTIRSHALKPDVTAYNYLLTSYCYVGDVENASKVMRKIEEEGKSPDTRTYDALVLGACRARKVEGAMVILRRMEDEKVPILYSTHAHVIGEMVRKRYYAQAVRFVVAYAGRDKRLDTESFGGLASKLMKRRRFEDAKLVLKEMDKRGLTMGDRLSDFYETHVNDIQSD